LGIILVGVASNTAMSTYFWEHDKTAFALYW
jgi:hypothetical protein